MLRTSSFDFIPAYIFPDALPVERWFKEHRPEVVISKGSFLLPQLHLMGLRIPRDVDFADVFLEEFSGQTAGVRQNHEAVGAQAVEILAGQLQHKKFGVPEIPTTTFVEGSWFDGKLCPV